MKKNFRESYSFDEAFYTTEKGYKLLDLLITYVNDI